MVFFNGYSLNETAEQSGLSIGRHTKDGYDKKSLRIPEMRKYLDIPIGVYLECGELPDQSNVFTMVTKDRIASRENIEKLQNEGANFIVLGDNLGTDTKFETVLETTRMAKR